MKIREATTGDLHEIIEMYQDLIKWVYPKRAHGSYEDFYDFCTDLILTDTKYVFVTYNEQEITGFSVIGFDDAGGLTEIVVNAEVAYVKEAYRKTKAAYLQYMKVYKYAQQTRMGLMTIANPSSAEISAKRFGSEVLFTHIEVPRKTIWESIK